MLESRKREIRIKADSFREKCKVGRYGIIDLFKECERAGYKLLRYPLGENADLGFMVKKDNDIVIFTNTCSRLSREIFTLAHEIGHVILHLEDEKPFIDDNVTINGRSTDEKEQEANYFAACLLMPANDVNRFIDLEIRDFHEKGLSAIDIVRIMSEFNVSFDMALNRLESLNVINQSRKLCLDNERIEKRVGNLLRSVGGNAKLDEFRAAMGICNLRHVDEEIQKRKKVYERYVGHLAGINGLTLITYNKEIEPNYSYFPLYIDEEEFGKNRDEVYTKLCENDIFSRRYFYPATNDLDSYKGKFAHGETPVAERVSKNILTLPMYADLAMEDVDRICGMILSLRM